MHFFLAHTVSFMRIFIILGIALSPTTLPAQTLFEESQGTWRGQVLQILHEEAREIPGTDTAHTYQTITASVLDGPKEGAVITIENDYLELEPGDTFYFNYNVFIDGSESYGVVNVDRTNGLFILIGIFVCAIIAFGGWQGVRSLIALAGSFVVLFSVLMPGILGGWNALLLSILVASGILFGAIFFTHGFNRESAVAYGGTMLAVLVTGLFAVFSVHLTNLSGFAADAAVYLNFNTGGTLNFTSLLIGAMIIGVLGVLDDVAITQAAVVTELYRSNPTLTRRDVYLRALRVGREHVGALVNTLVLAYTGASLPLLLHFSTVSSNVSMVLNTEIVATELVRTIVGSVGLVLTVPLVTLLAVIYLREYSTTHPSLHTHTHAH